MVQQEYAVHDDFQQVRIRAGRLQPWALPLINGVLKILQRFSKKPFNGTFSRRKIVGPDGNKITLTIIKPDGIPTKSPVLVYYHGGSFSLTYVPAHIENAKKYALGAGCQVVFATYRLAPKHRFPCGFNDAYASLLWTLKEADALGIDKNRVAVGGDSAGGALAASVAQKCVQADGIKLCGQLLIYPVTDRDCKTHSATAFTDTPGFNAAANRNMWEVYLGAIDGTAAPAYASPAHGKLSGVAAAYVELAEFDPLHDEARDYANALRASRVEVDLVGTKGTVHGFDVLVPGSEISQAAIARRIEFLKRVFAQ